MIEILAFQRHVTLSRLNLQRLICVQHTNPRELDATLGG